MKHKNLLFCLCIGFINVCIVIGIFAEIHHRANREAIPVLINTTQPMIALTFDDGPNSCYTPQVLDILYEQQVPATFFLVGEKFSGNELFIKEMASSGHEIGNHTFSHNDLTTLNKQQVQQEIQQTAEELKKILPDYPMQYFRPPYGRYTEEVEQATNFSLVLWTIDSGDWKNPDANKIYTNVLSNIQNGDIIVFHDNNAETVEALQKIIIALKARNFQFVTISQLYKMHL